MESSVPQQTCQKVLGQETEKFISFHQMDKQSGRVNFSRGPESFLCISIYEHSLSARAILRKFPFFCMSSLSLCLSLSASLSLTRTKFLYLPHNLISLSHHIFIHDKNSKIIFPLSRRHIFSLPFLPLSFPVLDIERLSL
jgi:hypothetical protein